jgi:hypothetical protein
MTQINSFVCVLYAAGIACECASAGLEHGDLCQPQRELCAPNMALPPDDGPASSPRGPTGGAAVMASTGATGATGVAMPSGTRLISQAQPHPDAAGFHWFHSHST